MEFIIITIVFFNLFYICSFSRSISSGVYDPVNWYSKSQPQSQLVDHLNFASWLLFS